MDHNQFQEWLSGVDGLGQAQKQHLQGVLSGEVEDIASLEAIGARLAENRQCPHCDTPGAISRGMARGLRRYQCKACKRPSTQQPAQLYRAFTIWAGVSPLRSASLMG